MGYNIRSGGGTVTISLENEFEILASIGTMFKEIGVHEKINKTLCKELQAWGFEVTGTDKKVTINDLEYNKHNFEMHKRMFDILAPHIKKESYLIYVGEDGYSWVYIFYSNKCEEYSIPKIIDYFVKIKTLKLKHNH